MIEDRYAECSGILQCDYSLSLLHSLVPGLTVRPFVRDAQTSLCRALLLFIVNLVRPLRCVPDIQAKRYHLGLATEFQKALGSTRTVRLVLLCWMQ